MTIYRLDNSELVAVERTSFASQGIRERDDLQQLIKERVETISPDTMVVAEEFGDWDDSRRRIDLLGIDKSANLVVIELKRTEDGGHMELQALRYAAMISSLTFEKLVAIYEKFLGVTGGGDQAQRRLLEFLDWDEPDEEKFGQEVKIVLASAEFSKELTTSVMWLNDFGLDIRCVRMHPYVSGEQTLIDIQTVIPIPEVADYQIRIREKKQKERESRDSQRDLTKYDIRVGKQTFASQTKRRMMYIVVRAAIDSGATPFDIMDAIDWRRNRLFHVFDGELSGEEVRKRLDEEDAGGAHRRVKRFFCEDGEIFLYAGETYVLTNQWGLRSEEAAKSVRDTFPSAEIEVKAAVN